VLIEFFRCVTAEARYEWTSVKNRRFRSNGGRFYWHEISGRRCRILLLRTKQTKLNDLSYGLKIWTDLSSILSQCMRLSDMRTDKQTAFSW